MRNSVEQPHLQGLAFLKEKPYIDGLSEGLVSPKRGSSKGSFFKHHSQADKAFFKSEQSRLISVLVGTQGGIEKWLKTSGPARCALWVECAHPGPEDLAPKESNFQQKGLLKLVYRQRDAQAFYQPVLPESTLDISVIQNAGNDARRGSSDILYDEGKGHDWTGLRHREIHRRNLSQESENYLWTWETRWSIVMKVAAFKQLSNMLSPGGVLWEFRRLLLQRLAGQLLTLEKLRNLVSSSRGLKVIHLPEFLDIDVRHLELSEWLAHHPYSVFVTGSDTLVARTTPKGLLVWTILRFDLSKGVILLTKGKNLKGLEQNFGNFDKKLRICDSSDLQLFGANEHHPDDQSGENFDQHPPVCGQLGWKVWRETKKQGDVFRPGPLETTLQSIFEGEADCMVLKSLNTCFSSWKQTYFHGFCLSTDLGTAFRESKGHSSFCGKLSTKERCALSHLRSATREVKLKGLRILLDLLLDVVGDPSITRQKSGQATARKHPRSTPVSSRTQSLMTPSQLQLPKAQDILEQVTEFEAERRTFFEERENLSLLSGLMAVMNRQDTGDHSREEKEKKFVGSQTERALKAAEMNWTRFEEMKSERSYALQDRSCLQTWYRLRWERVLEWLDYGFLEALLMEGVSKVCDNQSKDEQALSLSVRELADACTRVVEIVPRESCHRLVICLISLLHKVTEVILALNIVNPQTEKSSLSGKVPTIDVRECRTCVGKDPMELQKNLKEKVKLKEAFDEMVCVCRILSLLVSSSVMVAATLAKENGLMLIFELYSSLVEEFPLSLKLVGKSGEDPKYVLPGEVLEAEELSVKVLRTPASCLRFCDAQCQVEISDEAGSTHPSTNQIVSTSTTGLPWLLLGQGGVEVPLGLRGYKTKKTPVTETSIFSQFSQVLTTTRSDVGGRSEPDGEGATPEKRRPHVPRLYLSTLPVENIKQEVNSSGHDNAGLFNELLREGENDVFVSSRSAADGSVALMPHTIFNIVCEARLQLLQTLASILATNSITLNEIRSQLTQKLHEESGAKLVSGFLPDLIGGPLNRFPACVQGKFKKLIFRVLFLLDKSAQDHVDRHVLERICRVEEAEGPWWSGPGPPPVRNTVKRFSDAILVEIQERLDYVLSRLTASPPGCSSPINIEPISSCKETINVECHVKPINSRLWVDIARLAMILSDYVQVSPDKTCKSSDVLKFCRKQITDTLTLLSSLGATASWGPAPILAMQSVLKLFGVCIRDLLSTAHTSEHASGDADVNSLWQMMVETSVHWNCLESYLSWLTLDVCQGCLGILLDEFQKSLQEPVRLYYCGLGQKFGMTGISERVFASFQGLEASPKNVFGFLRLVVMLLRRRLDHWRGYMCSDDGFVMELPFTFLEGIMNPNDGLLLMAIKQGPHILLLHCKDEPAHLQEVDDLTPRQFESHTKVTMSKCSSWPWVSQPRSSLRKEALGLCAECANIVTNPNFAMDIAMGIEQESLLLLSEIFSLRVMSSERRLPNLNFVNPFLLCKYLDPFLDIVHSGFMNFYKKLSEVHTKCLHNDLSSSKGQKFCEETELEDQKISNLCCTYAEVLLAVAQNQSKDASQKFRKLCVMEFLVQQITLEYEFSQIAAPRLRRNEVEGTSVGQNSLQGMRSSSADVLSSGRDEETLRELCDTSSTSNSTSFRADSDLRAVSEGLKNKYTILAKLSDGQNSLEKEQQSQCQQLDFFSARDKRKFTMAVQQDQFDKCSSPACKEFMLQKEMKGNTIETPESILPLLERDQINRSLSEGGTDSTVTTGNLTRMTRELYTDDEGDNRGTRFVTDLYNPELANNLRPETMTSTELQSEEMKGSSRNAAAKLKKLVYSGRFFDLNEEVERELEAEDGEWMHGVRDSNSKGKQLKISSAKTSNETNWAHNFNSYEGLEDIFLSSHSLVSGSGSDRGNLMTQIRPLIPKLCFTKELQKCRLDEVLGIGERTEELRTCEQYLDRKSKNASAIGSKLFGLSLTYEKERWKRRIYQNGRLHRLLLELFILLMLNPEGSLEAYYSDRFPMENSKINAPFFLSYHVNHASNEYVMPQLVKSLEGDKLVSAFRILKLTWRGLFDPSIYTNRIQIAQGAFAQVYTATREEEEGGVTRKELVVLKVVDLPKGPREPCSFFDIYSEVQILELFRGDLRVCQILDYGIDCDTFVLVLKHYKCSLRAWRHRHTSECFVHERDCIAEGVNNEGVNDLPFHERLPLYLEVYGAVLHAVKALEIQNVVHYDLKCDNVLLEPLMSTLSDEEFWHPHWPPLDVTSAIPFRVSITDFGQSKASLWEGGACTVRNRGTECVKSPEMLKLLSTNPDALQTGSSRTAVDLSVGKAGDVWGLGCLLYELLTGEYLLYDEDWLQFFMRATSNTEEIIPDEKAAKVDNFTPVIDFLRFVLVRDPNDRPTLDDLMEHLERLQTKLIEEKRIVESVGNGFDEPPATSEQDPAVVVGNARSPKETKSPEMEKTQATKRITCRKAGKVKKAGVEMQSKFTRVWWRYCACCWKNVELAS